MEFMVGPVGIAPKFNVGKRRPGVGSGAALIGYARVSTTDQNPDHQVDALLRAGVAERDIYLDTASGAKGSQPKFDLVMHLLRGGDTPKGAKQLRRLRWAAGGQPSLPRRSRAATDESSAPATSTEGLSLGERTGMDEPTQRGPRTFALIPGAGGVAAYWDRLVPLLRAAGHEAVAVELPGEDPKAGLPEYAGLVGAAVEGRGDVVLVAQSLGGFTAPLVAASVPVSAIVFVNAMIPVPGETPGAWWDATGQTPAAHAAAERGGYGTEFDLETYFLHDLSAEDAAPILADRRPEDDVVFQSVCAFDDWPAVPLKVVVGAGDRFFPVDFQQRVARDRLGVEADVLPGGHLLALSQPDALARYLIGI